MKYVLFTFCTLLSFSSFAQQETENKPRAVFGELKHQGPYDRSELLLQEKLTVSSGDGHQYKIVKFKLIVLAKAGAPASYNGMGNALTPKMQAGLNPLVGGDRIIVESIYASKDGDKSNLVQLEPIVLQVRKFENDGPYMTAYPGRNEPIKLDSLAFATLGNLELGIPHTLKDILKHTKVEVQSDNELSYTITSFKLITAPKNGPASMATSSNNMLTKQMQKMLSKLVTGDRILIEAIRATSEIDGKTERINLSPIVITVL